MVGQRRAAPRPWRTQTNRPLACGASQVIRRVGMRRRCRRRHGLSPSEQWNRKQSVDQASWLLGAEIWDPKIKGAALRSVKAPGTAYDDPAIGKDNQPSHMKDYSKTADIYTNSGIPNRAFYEVARLIGGYAWEKPGRIWYQSLLKLDSKATFKKFARVTYDTAGDLYGVGKPEQDAVKKGWEIVGIDVKGNQ